MPDPAAVIAAHAEPLPPFDDPEFCTVADRFADARIVLLGEASHGTAEFYRADPEAARVARDRYGCLTPWRDDPARYGRRAMTTGYAECEDAVVDMLVDLFSKSQDYGSVEDDDFLDAAANARLVADAEAYYRVMYHGAAESWNLRDTHMADTLDLLLAARGEGAKAVVWAHNSHLGDARATDMGRRRGELNLGQLARERHGDAVVSVGFGTHTGTVAAASDWDEPMEVKRVNPSRPDSIERLCHDCGLARFILDLGTPAVRDALAEERLERFIGVIYRPDTERWSHYAEAVLPAQFDHWIWFDETSAVVPLGDEPTEPGAAADELWPSGL